MVPRLLHYEDHEPAFHHHKRGHVPADLKRSPRRSVWKTPSPSRRQQCGGQLAPGRLAHQPSALGERRWNGLVLPYRSVPPWGLQEPRGLVTGAAAGGARVHAPSCRPPDPTASHAPATGRCPDERAAGISRSQPRQLHRRRAAWHDAARW